MVPVRPDPVRLEVVGGPSAERPAVVDLAWSTSPPPALVPPHTGVVQVAGIADALGSVFASPLGLLALLAVVPIVALYLLKPDPEELSLPTARFLAEGRGRDNSATGLRRLQRALLLLLQVLVVVAIAVSLASPYVSVAQDRTVEETVVVVDASASMATGTDSGTRFDAAIDAAREVVADRTTVVVAGAGSRIAVRRGSPTETRRTLDRLRVQGTSGNLREAVRRAASVGGEDARIVVLSDFAGDSDWRTAVRVARARGKAVELRQFAGGGRSNVGIVAVSFEDGSVTAAVRNYGDASVTRRVALGNSTTSVRLGPNDTATATLPVPPGGGEVRLSPGDDFASDDVVPVAAPEAPGIDVLLLTNRPESRLRTALSVVDAVDLTVKEPPATVQPRYDVVVFGAVVPQRVLDGSVQVARETLQAGGGVAIQARPDLARAGYGDLLPIEPRGTARNATLSRTARDPLTEGISFPPPSRYLRANLTRGESLVGTVRGSPIVARAAVDGGQVLYYGYFGDGSLFRYNYMYPVFWKRAVFELSGRPSLASLNRRTGSRLSAPGGAGVTGPGGRTVTPSRGNGSGDGGRTGVVLDRVGFYEVGDRRYAAALLSRAESSVRAEPIGDGPDAIATGRTESRTVPRDLTPYVAGIATLLVLTELAYLRYRGDL